MTKNRIGGAILFLVGLAYFIAACNLPTTAISGGIGSAFFPQMSSVGLMVCAVGVFFSKSNGKEPTLSKVEFKRCAIYFGILLAYVATVWLVGFVPATLVFCYISVSVMAPDGIKIAPWKRACFSIGVTAVTYLLFVKVFYLMLPTGKLF